MKEHQKKRVAAQEAIDKAKKDGINEAELAKLSKTLQSQAQMEAKVQAKLQQKSDEAYAWNVEQRRAEETVNCLEAEATAIWAWLEKKEIKKMGASAMADKSREVRRRALGSAVVTKAVARDMRAFGAIAARARSEDSVGNQNDDGEKRPPSVRRGPSGLLPRPRFCNVLLDKMAELAAWGVHGWFRCDLLSFVLLLFLMIERALSL